MASVFYSQDYEPRCEICRNGDQHSLQQSKMQHYLAQSQLISRTPERIISQRILAQPKQPQVVPQQPIVYQQKPIMIQHEPQLSYVNHIQQEQSKSYVTHVHNVEHVPVVHELHHVNRAVSVVSVEEIEGPWRSKVLKLEKQLLELELMVKKNGGKSVVESKQVVVEDLNAIKQLEQEVDHLEKLLRQKEIQIDELNNQIMSLEQELENGDVSNQEALDQYDKELAEWKKKFQTLNRDFHNLQEDLMMKQAEIESIKKRTVVVQKEVKTTVNPTTTSSVRRSIHQSGEGSTYSNRRQY